MNALLDLSIHKNSSVMKTQAGLTGGNGTERALYAFIKNKTQAQILEKMPFDSKRKYSSAVIVYGGETWTLCKGAPELLIGRCGEYLNESFEKKRFDQKETQKLVKNITKQGSRVLALIAARERPRSGEMLPENALFLALAVMNDPLRPTANKAVNDLKNAGVRTVMITGDGEETARRIAAECGILHDGGIVIGGKELKEKTDTWVKDHLTELSVVYRAMPGDKNRLVKLSREKGLIAGMTGDGVNDAPALKNADVGFAMGAGNEVAKEAGDVIILDNDLKSIVSAVLYGRTIFKSIRKFITCQLIMNICAVGVTLFGQLLGVDSPITVIQMLWVNLIMDTLGGLAFAGEYPHKWYLMEKPIAREEPILQKKTFLQIFLLGGCGAALCTAFLGSQTVRRVLRYDSDPNILLTAFFALFIFTGLVICFTARSERMNIFSGLLKNKSFTVIMLLIVGIQLLMLYFGGKTFRCVGMNAKTLCAVLMLSLSVLPVDLVRRFTEKILRKKIKNRQAFDPN